jgi:hypothetical protein
MNNKSVLISILYIALIALLLAGCGGTSAADKAVCDAYQQLVDAWPATSEEVKAATSVDEIYGKIADAGKALIAASEKADTPDLAAAGKRVGENAAGFAEKNANLIKSGFVPFFAENLIDGSELSQLCQGIESPIKLP